MTDLKAQTSQHIQAHSAALAAAIVEQQVRQNPPAWQTYGDAGRKKSLRDAEYHLAYLSQAIASASPALFADYVGWVKALFVGLRMPADTLERFIENTRLVLRASLDLEMSTLADTYLTAGLLHLQQAPTAPPLFVAENLPLGGLAKDYLTTLLNGDRRSASLLIMQAVENGISIRDLYLHVFQRVQYEIGRLWQINQLGVAQEHFCTAATQLIMSQLYPYIFRTERTGRRLVATCVGGELHEIGVRMVADFFEMEGWDTYYLGANTPTNSIIQALEERSAQVLGISATITFHIGAVADLITQVRATEAGRQVKILVGGYPFRASPDLWRSVGADGYGSDAQQAIEIANQWLVSP